MNTHEIITLCAIVASTSYLVGRADEKMNPNSEVTLGFSFIVLLSSIVSTAVAITVRVLR